VRVKIPAGELSSNASLQIFSGANAAAIQNADGDWEVIQFLNAGLVDSATYQLSGLLRGQAGTEGAMRTPVAAGAPFVLLDGALVRVPLGLSELKRPLNWRYGPSNRDLADASYAVTPHAYQGLGLRPLSPVHVKASRAANGDLSLSWIRRTRIGGDSWEVADVPLAETSEAYEVDILSGSMVKRTLAAGSTFAIYTAAQQTADFGAVQSSIAVAVYQVSAVYGRGAPRAATL
jgi:hypothetical protein